MSLLVMDSFYPPTQTVEGTNYVQKRNRREPTQTIIYVDQNDKNSP